MDTRCAPGILSRWSASSAPGKVHVGSGGYKKIARASATTVASTTAVVMVQRDPTQITARAVHDREPSVNRDRDVTTISPLTV